MKVPRQENNRIKEREEWRARGGNQTAHIMSCACMNKPQ